MVTAFKNRTFVLQDTTKSRSNLRLFEEVVKDSIKNFSLKFDTWFKQQYNFYLYKEESQSAKIYITIPQQIDNAWVLLYETNEKTFKFKEPVLFKELEQELKAIENDYQKIKNDDNAPAANRANTNMTMQSTPVDDAAKQRIEIQRRLENFDKKLRKIIFDKTPKTAN